MKPLTKHKIKFGASRQHKGDLWSWSFALAPNVWYKRLNYLQVNAGVDFLIFTVWVEWRKPRTREHAERAAERGI